MCKSKTTDSGFSIMSNDSMTHFLRFSTVTPFLSNKCLSSFRDSRTKPLLSGWILFFQDRCQLLLPLKLGQGRDQEEKDQGQLRTYLFKTPQICNCKNHKKIKILKSCCDGFDERLFVCLRCLTSRCFSFFIINVDAFLDKLLLCFLEKRHFLLSCSF